MLRVLYLIFLLLFLIDKVAERLSLLVFLQLLYQQRGEIQFLSLISFTLEMKLVCEKRTAWGMCRGGAAFIPV